MPYLPAETFDNIRNFIKLNTGLSFSNEKQIDLEYGLQNVAHEYGVTDLQNFAEFLLSRPLSTEIKHSLQRNLTIGETYFFRENPIIDKFKNILLQIAPEKRKTAKTLRIWSSGCSSGEEPYSLAITIAETLPDFASWDITLIGTDINTSALEKAETGIYRNWSFRGVDQRIINKYFTETIDNGFAVKDSIKNMVDFIHLNLFEDPYPSPLTKTYSLDFIFCRNVIMYFDDTGRKKVLNGFYNSLTNKGYLFLSLTELAHQSDRRFVTRKEGSVVYYQKDISVQSFPNQVKRPASDFLARSDTARSSISEPLPVSPSLKNTKEESGIGYSLSVSIRGLYESEKFDEAAALTGKLIPQLLSKTRLLSNEVESAILIIKVLSHAGKTNEALQFTYDILPIEKTTAELHYLQGTLLREKNNLQLAEQSFCNCLFLQPDYTAALFALANVQRQLGKNQESLRTFNNLLSVLSKIPGNEIGTSLEGVSSGELYQITVAAIQNLTKKMQAV